MKVIQEIKQLILNEVDIKQYISAMKSYNRDYRFSDSSRVYEKGLKDEEKINKLYDRLSDDDKISAGKWFKDNGNYDDGSQHSKGVKSWDIEKDGVDGFSGTYYRT
tara:strand:+ start:6113 stop:6430 length:318 start_codon:yes stop_codon:yes gene_type:complete